MLLSQQMMITVKSRTSSHQKSGSETSDYEKQRLENIKENGEKNMLEACMLKITQVSSLEYVINDLCGFI